MDKVYGIDSSSHCGGLNEKPVFDRARLEKCCPRHSAWGLDEQA